jgi:hypothetical protein
VVRRLRAALYRRLVLVLPWATMVERSARFDGLAVSGVSSTDASPSRGRAGGADVTEEDDVEQTPEQAVAAAARMERLSRLSATDVVRMRVGPRVRLPPIRVGRVHELRRGGKT